MTITKVTTVKQIEKCILRVIRPKFDLINETDEEIFATDPNNLCQSYNVRKNFNIIYNSISISRKKRILLHQ